MRITKDEFTTTALGLVQPERKYDRFEVARGTAKELAEKLYNEFGGCKAMSLLQLSELEQIFVEMAMSAIDWTRLNRKAEPRDFADNEWRWVSENEPPIQCEAER